MKVLIVGAGIAGPTLAYWLRRSGHEPTLIERSPTLREGGYLVDFWGSGFEVADRMGIVPRLVDEGYRVREVREVSPSGRRIAHMDPRPVIEGAGGRYVSIARSDLAATIYDALGGEVESIFDDTVHALHDDGECVGVEFERGAPRDFDLVVGADGLHSRVRELAFGPESGFERDLGVTVAAFDIDGYRPRDEFVAVTHTQVDMQALRFALRDGATMFFFVFRNDGDHVSPEDVPAQQEVLRLRLAGMGWEVPAILDRMPEARTFYFDRVSQILMPSWSRGRVGLIGDAAACPSLLAGQGSALAMVEAYVLAAEFRAREDYRAAYTAYEEQLRALVRSKQDAAIGLGAAFAPRNVMQLLLRNAVVGLMGIPLVANLAMGRTLRDPIELPALRP